MPILLKKDREVMRRVDDVKPLFNAEQHYNKQVRIIRGKYAGRVGKITRAVTANIAGTYKRFVFYEVELASVILDCLTWDDFLWLNSQK